MTNPPRANNPPSPHLPAQNPPTKARRSHRNRRQYALPKFDFEDPTQAPPETESLASYGLAQPSANSQPQPYQLPRPVPVSPCINATDRAYRARRRQARVNQSTVEDTFCDITPLLEQSPKRKVVGGIVGEDDDIPDMMLDEEKDEEELDEEELDEEFEVIEKRECGVVHNGTVRRWYRGFRH